MEKNKIYQGHALEILKQLPDQSVDMCFTSPPYYGLRDYGEETKTIWDEDPNCKHKWIKHIRKPTGGKGSKCANVGANKNDFANMRDHDVKSDFCIKCNAWFGALGLEPDYNSYIKHLLQIFKEVKRVLKDTGSFYLNIGDTYGGFQGKNAGWPDSKTKADLPTMRKPKSFSKCLMGIPERVMFGLIDVGFVLRNKIIWHKLNSMPSPVLDRYTCSFEYLYFFTKLSDKKSFAVLKSNPPKDRKTKKLIVSEEEWEKIKPDWKSECRKYNSEGILPIEIAKKFDRRFYIGLTYYFDLDMVRKPHQVESNIARPRMGQGEATQYRQKRKEFQTKIPKETAESFGSPRARNWRQEAAKKGQLFDSPVAHQGGGNTGLKRKKTADEKFRKSGMRQSPEPGEEGAFNAKGKNPSDIIQITTHIATGKPQNPGDFHSLPTQPFPEAHFAVFPVSFPLRYILASCPPNGIVLDPFVGAGTVGLVVKVLKRNYIGIEISPSYIQMAEIRIKNPDQHQKVWKTIEDKFPEIYKKLHPQTTLL